MGEEWGASTPWCYFTSHTDRELAEAVRKGRREEFAAFGWDPELVPDPQDPGTFEASRLDWDETHTGQHAELLDWHKALVRLRGEHVDLVDGRFDAVTVTYDDAARWIVVRRGSLAVACNLGARRQTVPLPAAATSVLLASGPGHAHDSSSVTLEPESVAIVGLADS